MFKKYFVFIPISISIIITLYLTLQKEKPTKKKKEKRLVLYALIFIGLALTLGLVLNIRKTRQQIVGNDTDQYGCIPSAGYMWCEPKQKCLRNWEEPCK